MEYIKSFTAHRSLYMEYFKQYITYLQLYFIHSISFTIYRISQIANIAQFIVHRILQIVHCILFTVQCTLYIVHYTTPPVDQLLPWITKILEQQRLQNNEDPGNMASIYSASIVCFIVQITCVLTTWRWSLLTSSNGDVFNNTRGYYYYYYATLLLYHVISYFSLFNKQLHLINIKLKFFYFTPMLCKYVNFKFFFTHFQLQFIPFSK